LAWLTWEIKRENIIAAIRSLEKDSKELLSAELRDESLRTTGEETRLEIADRRRRMRSTEAEERSLIESLLIIK
jgi:hypothetical protein